MKDGESYSDVSELITDRLWVYLRNDAQSGYYYARAKFPPQSGYKVFSTKSKERSQAHSIAQNRYYELAGRASLNINTKTQSLTTLMLEYLNYKDRLRSRAPDHKTKYRDIFERFIKPFYGQTKVDDLHKLKQSDINDYWTFRLEYWKNRSASPQIIKSRYGHSRAKFMNAHKMAGRSVGYYTLQVEAQLFRSFFKWAVSNGHLLPGNVPDVVNPVPKIDKETANLRGVFTDSEYDVVKQHIMTTAKKYKDLANEPKQHDLDVFRFRAERMYCFFFTMSAFGIRPGEAKHITFDMVKLLKDPKSDKYFSIIDLPHTITKANPDGSRKGRRVFSFDNHLAFNRIHKRWRSYLVSVYGDFDDSRMYVFPKWIPAKDRYEERYFNRWTKPKPFNVYIDKARMDTSFRKLLQNIGLHKDEHGRNRSAYALRKFYITSRIRHNTPLPALAINTGHDIQTMWRWYQHISSDDMAEYLTRRDPEQFKRELMLVDSQD